MGLLDLFRKKDKGIQTEKPEDPEALAAYANMRVEVTTPEGRLLFVARLRNLRGNTAELYQYSESEISKAAETPEDAGESSGEPAGEAEPIRAKIRGYHDREKKAVYMEGLITPRPYHIWQAEELTVTGTGNDRAFFRLDTNIEATAVTIAGPNAGDRPCRLMNISVGGACIASDFPYEEGDKFLLKARLLEDREMSALFCQVTRIIDKGEGRFEYGCRFLELNDADQEKITQNIFAVQRRQRGTY